MMDLSFRSPLRKLVVFFRNSRDQWKKKCQDAKYELKLLKRRLDRLQKNHDRWQHQYREVESQLLETEQRRQELHSRLECLLQERAACS